MSEISVPEKEHFVSAEHTAWLAWSEAFAALHFRYMEQCPRSMPASERRSLADAACAADQNLCELYQKWQSILNQEKAAINAFTDH